MPRAIDGGIGRRSLLRRAGALAATAMLGGCDRLSASPRVQQALDGAEAVTRWVQRQVIGRDTLAQEFTEADISKQFKANGSVDPDEADYRRLADGGFAEWRLSVSGLVQHPRSYSLAELRAMPARTQITRHDCVEGWSCIGKWTGVPLASLIEQVGLSPGARYLVFRCFDSLDDGPDKYYESIDLVDAFHPQTILAYAMNDQPLPVPHGAPLRLRVERQLGYKMAKYLAAIEVVDHRPGRGGYWEDRGYEWYAGI